jgi:hypothetical protein
MTTITCLRLVQFTDDRCKFIVPIAELLASIWNALSHTGSIPKTSNSEIHVVRAFLLIGEYMHRSNKTPEEHDREKWARKHATLKRFAALRSAEVRVR